MNCQVVDLSSAKQNQSLAGATFYGVLLRHIHDVRSKHEAVLRVIPDEDERLDRLCELNVVEQAHDVCHTTVVQEAWEKGQSLAVHGWIYKIQDGLIRGKMKLAMPTVWQSSRTFSRSIATCQQILSIS